MKRINLIKNLLVIFITGLFCCYEFVTATVDKQLLLPEKTTATIESFVGSYFLGISKRIMDYNLLSGYDKRSVPPEIKGDINFIKSVITGRNLVLAETICGCRADSCVIIVTGIGPKYDCLQKERLERIFGCKILDILDVVPVVFNTIPTVLGEGELGIDISKITGILTPDQIEEFSALSTNPDELKAIVRDLVHLGAHLDYIIDATRGKKKYQLSPDVLEVRLSNAKKELENLINMIPSNNIFSKLRSKLETISTQEIKDKQYAKNLRSILPMSNSIIELAHTAMKIVFAGIADVIEVTAPYQPFSNEAKRALALLMSAPIDETIASLATTGKVGDLAGVSIPALKLKDPAFNQQLLKHQDENALSCFLHSENLLIYHDIATGQGFFTRKIFTQRGMCETCNPALIEYARYNKGWGVISAVPAYRKGRLPGMEVDCVCCEGDIVNSEIATQLRKAFAHETDIFRVLVPTLASQTVTVRGRFCSFPQVFAKVDTETMIDRSGSFEELCRVVEGCKTPYLKPTPPSQINDIMLPIALRTEVKRIFGPVVLDLTSYGMVTPLELRKQIRARVRLVEAEPSEESFTLVDIPVAITGPAQVSAEKLGKQEFKKGLKQRENIIGECKKGQFTGEGAIKKALEFLKTKGIHETKTALSVLLGMKKKGKLNISEDNDVSNPIFSIIRKKLNGEDLTKNENEIFATG
jgi:hypothetical protein